MREEQVIYQVREGNFKGFLVGSGEKRPGVLVAHAWRGQDDFAREKARELARMGYVALAVDMYGEGKRVTNDEQAAELMKPLFQDRSLVQERITAAFEFLKKDPRVDPERIGGIGFCFGGLVMLELLRTGLPVKSAVSFHGVLGDTIQELHAKPGVRGQKIKGSILLLHGYEDPMVSQQDIVNLQQELNEAGADWEMTIYGQTKHAFMNPMANNLAGGMVYNERSAKRGWQAMIQFFKETLG